MGDVEEEKDIEEEVKGESAFVEFRLFQALCEGLDVLVV